MAELYKCPRLDPEAFKISKNFLFDRLKLEVERVLDLRRFSAFSVSTAQSGTEIAIPHFDLPI